MPLLHDRRWMVRAAALLLAGLATASSATPAPPTSTPVTAAPATPPAPRPTIANAKPALWIVRDEDTVIYLFGTIHVLRADVNWFNPRIRQAFNESDELITEIPEEEFADMMPLLIQRASTDDGEPLTAHLTADQLSLYRRAMARLRLPVAMFEGTEPWVPTFLLMGSGGSTNGYSARYGVETVLNRAARDRRMAASGLESLDMQIGFFDHLSMATQVDMLMGMSQAIVEPCACAGRRGGLDAIVEMWAAGDVDALAAANAADLENEPAEFHQVLLPDRNDRWSQWIQLRLNEPGGKFFVAVGAAHLAGPESVQSFLARAGITAERVEY